MHRALALCLGSASAFAAGCGTLVHGPTQAVQIVSVPAGATVTVDGREAGPTPLTLNLDRGRDHELQISSAGSATLTRTLSRTLTPWAWGNVVFLGLPGIVVDAHSGALYDLVPWRVSVALADLPSAPADAPADVPASR